MPRISVRQLLAEVPSTDHIVRHESTGWVRLTIAMDNGAVYVADVKNEHFRRIPQSKEAA